jgi:hypothetical protein
MSDRRDDRSRLTRKQTVGKDISPGPVIPPSP